MLCIFKKCFTNIMKSKQWQKHMLASSSHTYSFTASGALKKNTRTTSTPRKPQIRHSSTFTCKAVHSHIGSRDHVHPRMQIAPDSLLRLSPEFTPYFLILHVQMEGRRKHDCVYDFKERRKIDNRKEPELLHTPNTSIFKHIQNKWKTLELKIVMVDVLEESRVNVCACVRACVMLSVNLSWIQGDDFESE